MSWVFYLNILRLTREIKENIFILNIKIYIFTLLETQNVTSVYRVKFGMHLFTIDVFMYDAQY